MSPPRVLIVETSGRVGQVALAWGPELRRHRWLDEARRHARDLAPAVAELLAAEGWRPRDLDAVLVSRGPGSYTGLRVGLMAAKTLAYAVGCPLLAVDTFAAIARQAPPPAGRLHVIADAQQDHVYVQRFTGPERTPDGEVVIRLFGDWCGEVQAGDTVSGPGLRGQLARLPAGLSVVEADAWDPRAESVLAIGLARLLAGERDDPWTVEPLYLRPSAAEQQWRGRQP